MEIIKSILLGIVQGLTEFLPISSSGHLEIFKVILGFETGLNNNILFTLILHLATSFSVIVVYWNDIKKILKSIFRIKKDENTYFFSLILISIFPAGIVGFFFEEKISNLFDGNIILVGSMLLFTSMILFISDFKINTTNKLDYVKSFFVGVSQALAIIPGVSRSGITISIALLLGWERKDATKFSFLLGLPAISLAAFVELFDFCLLYTSDAADE